ncbi:unnamed protein product [Staurois parvus]|uniref:Uncharacterized protein n=1 Tax=Staurois parvus TaxID=386267 RepID=A0ABN9A8G2_9NEOB|nr:unnamed protein product [Staurois parvus]
MCRIESHSCSAIRAIQNVRLRCRQRLQTYYRRQSETADTVQEMVRDCRHSTGDGQRLQT